MIWRSMGKLIFVSYQNLFHSHNSRYSIPVAQLQLCLNWGLCSCSSPLLGMVFPLDICLHHFLDSFKYSFKWHPLNGAFPCHQILNDTFFHIPHVPSAPYLPLAHSTYHWYTVHFMCYLILSPLTHEYLFNEVKDFIHVLHSLLFQSPGTVYWAHDKCLLNIISI
jgi:hypothetical protein